MRRLAFVAAILAAGALAPAAAAHIEVLPATVAPGDPTLFTLLVPNERDAPTVAVELKIPDGLVPFSFEEAMGWTRTEKRKADGSIDVVRWKGSLPPESFVRFSFLASTPQAEGDLSFPAVQTYEDGTKVRWIGPPESDEPAAIVTVSASAPPQNAGGEGSEDGAEPVDAAPAETAAAPAASESGGGGGNGLALAVGIAGLVAGLVALGVALRRRPERT